MTRCFVIGPIGDRFAPIGSEANQTFEQALEVYEKVIVAACGQVGLTPVRADQIAIAGDITEQVFRHLYEDEVVIADVSGGNPNVMYELGLRHTRNLLTIQIGEYGQLPFDIHAIRTIEFSRSERGLIDARNKLQLALTVGLAEGSDPVTATKVWMGATAAGDGLEFDPDVVGIETDVEEVSDAAGFLDSLAHVEESFPRLTQWVGEIAAHMEGMGSEAEASGREFETLNQQQAPASARLAAVARFANSLDGHATALEELTSKFAKEMDDIDGSINGLLEFLSESPTSWPDDAEEFLSSVSEMAATARIAMESAGQFASSTRDLGRLSRALRRPSERVYRAFMLMSDKIRLMDHWESSVIRLRRAREAALRYAEADTSSAQEPTA